MSESVADFADLEKGYLTRSPLGTSLARRLLLKQLGVLRHGHLRLIEGPGVGDGLEHVFGDGEGAEIRVLIHDARFYPKIAFGGRIGAGESYMAGHWTANNLTALVQLLVKNRELIEGLDSGWARVTKPLVHLFHRLRHNTRAGSRRNIGAHYDLSNDFFKLFLDSRMMYSCAIYDRPQATLDEASVAKLERICQKLDLQPEDHVLEIGTGWGGFAIHAATYYGCRVTTTTISPAQAEHARAQVRNAGLENRILVLMEDYRDLTGQFDKLVSIEMIEAIGLKHLDGFFAKCGNLLKSDGTMVLQSITIADRFYEQASQSVDFIQRYIFPGSALPSVGALATSVARASQLTAIHLEDIGPHYALTLRAWRERFQARLDEVRALGFSERFIRMWEYYLCYCEGGFLERSIGDVQLVLAGPGCRPEPILGRLP